MSNTPFPSDETTAVDDVRHVREQLDRESGGDMRKHIASTNAAFEKLHAKLKLKLVPAPSRPGSSRVANG